MREIVGQMVKKIAQTTGFRPIEVEFDNLAKEASRYNGKWVQTEGLYLPVVRTLSREEVFVPGPSTLPDVFLERFVVAEKGILTDGNVKRWMRVYREFSFGQRYDQAQDAVEMLSDAQRLTVQGDVVQGFPGEYYLRSAMVSSR